ncbi:hypothetical protein KY385_00395 [Candidatus Parcubacteria bacterium]|nr:hypothetical protein [Candidatus Parcubacteria bacterium]
MDSAPRQKVLKPVIAVIVIVIILLFAFSWLLTRGVEDGRDKERGSSEQSTETVPPEPTDPNVTGGSDGAGNNTSNDPELGRPSPAGGVDTNQVPVGDSSY